MRRVASYEGSQYYGLPIGSPITQDAIDKARVSNNGKAAPSGSTAQSSSVRSSSAQRMKTTSMAEASRIASRKVLPKIGFTPPPAKPKKGPQVKAGSAVFGVDKESKTFSLPGSTVSYNVDPEGTLRVLTPNGEAKLSPDAEAKVKSLMVADRSELDVVVADQPSSVKVIDSSEAERVDGPDVKPGDVLYGGLKVTAAEPFGGRTRIDFERTEGSQAGTKDTMYLRKGETAAVISRGGEKPADSAAPEQPPAPKSRFAAREFTAEEKAATKQREDAAAKRSTESAARSAADKNQKSESSKTGVFNEYDPSKREAGSDVETTRLTDLDGYEMDQEVTVYRGIPSDAQGGINAGDWVTPDERLAKDYAGTGSVVSLKVKAQDLRTDPEDDSFAEMVYTPEAAAAPTTDEEVQQAPTTDEEVQQALFGEVSPDYEERDAAARTAVDRIADRIEVTPERVQAAWSARAEIAGTVDQGFSRDDAVAALADTPYGAALQYESFSEGIRVFPNQEGWRPGRTNDREIFIPAGTSQAEVEKLVDDHVVKSSVHSLTLGWKSSATGPQGKAITDAVARRTLRGPVSENRTFADDYVDAVYDNTQQELAARGITSVKAYRGVRDTTADNLRADLPVASWTTIRDQAQFFARQDGGMVLEKDVPASEIFSVGGIGPGSPLERELLVMSPPAPAASASAATAAPSPEASIADAVASRDWNAVETKVRATLEGKTYGDGFSVQIDSFDADEDGESANFRGSILKNGKVVGNLHRSINDYSVGHLDLNVDSEERGRGFSTDFSTASEDLYREMGVDRITATASADGAYVWAKAGYEFNTESSIYDAGREQISSQMRGAISKIKYPTGPLDGISDLWTPELQAQVDDLREKIVSDNPPSPKSIADLTAPGIPDLGRRLLNYTSWPAVKELNPTTTSGISLEAPRKGAKDAKHDMSMVELGTRYSADIADDPEIQRLKEDDMAWDEIPSAEITLDNLISTEEYVQSRHVNKVVVDGEPLRKGYDPKILRTDDGDIIIDGHTRVAMHKGLGRGTMKAQIMDVRTSELAQLWAVSDVVESHTLENKSAEFDNDSSEASLAARAVYAMAVDNEPTVSGAMLTKAQVFGGRMVGFAYRRKDPGSLTRKIRMGMLADGATGAEAAKKIRDALRYTMRFDTENFSSNSQSVLDSLRAEGYTNIKIKNTMGNGNVDPTTGTGYMYRGVNTTMVAPDGTPFELQFHTVESLQIKMNGDPALPKDQQVPNHVHYEEYRDLKKSIMEIAASGEAGERQDELDALNLQYDELEEIMIALNASIPTPLGIDSLS